MTSLVEEGVLAAQFRRDGLLGFKYLFDLLAEVFRQDPQLAHEALPAGDLQTCCVIASPHRTIERHMPLQYACADSRCNERRVRADLVPRGSDERLGKFLVETRNICEMELFILGGVRRDAVKNDESVLTEDMDYSFYHLVVGHSRRDDHGTLLRFYVLQKILVGVGRRSNLVGDRLKFLQEIHRALVPRRGEPKNALLFAVRVDFLVFRSSEFKDALEVAVGGVLRIFVEAEIG